MILTLQAVLGGAHSALDPALGPDTVRIVFAPRPGAKLTKTFDLELELELQDTLEWSARREGKYLDVLAWPRWFERVVRTEERRVVLTDEYQKLGQGRPLELRRTFEQLDVDVSQGISCPSPSMCFAA